MNLKMRTFFLAITILVLAGTIFENFAWAISDENLMRHSDTSAGNRQPQSEDRGDADLNIFLLSGIKAPSPEAFIKWTNVPGYRNSNYDLSRMGNVAIRCRDSILFPVNPQQTTKKYHLYLRAEYDVKKLQTNSFACKFGSSTKNAKGIQSCFVADGYDVTVISDMFQDNCGNFYRAYWRVEFLTSTESMGTLLSKGRDIYPKPNPEYPQETEDGPTRAVDKSDFLFLTELFPGDQERMARAQATALNNGFSYDPLTKLFLRVQH